MPNNKATLTKHTLQKLSSISLITKFMKLERTIRLSCFTDTLKFGTTLSDIPTDFSLPINNLGIFISMCESVMGKDDTVDIMYDVVEKEHGLEVKKLFTTTIANKEQEFILYSFENEDFSAIINNDKSDKSKLETLPESYIDMRLTAGQLKTINSNLKILGADTINFRFLDRAEGNGYSKIKIYDSKIPDGPFFDLKIVGAEAKNPSDFPLLAAMFAVIDQSLDYRVVINCEKKAILFANEETGTFFITSAKKASRFES